MGYKDQLGIHEDTAQDALDQARRRNPPPAPEPDVEDDLPYNFEDPKDIDPFKDHPLDPYDYVNQLMRLGTEDGILDAANFLKEHLDHKGGEIQLISIARKYLNTVWHSLLDADMYLEAATMNWGYNMVDCRPQTVKELSEFLQTQNKMAIMGASSMSKSYFGVAWLYLDYQRDPDYTGIKLVTISKSKLESLLFSPLLEMHRHSVMDVIGKEESEYRFTHKEKNVNVGFQGLLVQQDQKGTGKVKGIKFFRRPKSHPVFGQMSRMRIFIDEFQDCSTGIMGELSSPSASIEDPHSMKIILSGNPTDYALAEAFGILTEPPDGWMSLDMEKDIRWKSKKGYEVYRLDGKRCENVIHQKNLCPGMMSHSAYTDFSIDMESPEYWTFARGMFPIRGGINTLFSIALLEEATAQSIFHEGSTPVAFLDVGLRNDKAVLAIGRIGKATGRISPLGERMLFTTGTDEVTRLSRIVLYLEELIEITEHYGDPVKLAQAARRICTQKNVLPNHIGVDSTGMGEGVASYLINYFGRILSVHNSASP